MDKIKELEQQIAESGWPLRVQLVTTANDEPYEIMLFSADSVNPNGKLRPLGFFDLDVTFREIKAFYTGYVRGNLHMANDFERYATSVSYWHD